MEAGSLSPTSPLRTSLAARLPDRLLRWVLFRVMFGAGLIKLRGDACWRDLTCMQYHYETQPLPNPLSWYLHQLPPAVHQAEVLVNHGVELLAPWLLFAPRPLRHAGALAVVVFQILLILSGNLSFQVEHHLYPDMPSSRYKQIAPRVKEICERYDLPYNTGPFLKQLGTVQRTIVRLAFPGGRPRRKAGPYAPPPVTPAQAAEGPSAETLLPAFP